MWIRVEDGEDAAKDNEKDGPKPVTIPTQPGETAPTNTDDILPEPATEPNA